MITLVLCCVLIITLDIGFVETVFLLQAKLNLTDNIKILITFVEKKNIEAEIAVVFSKTNLNNVRSAIGILENGYIGSSEYGTLN